MTTPCRHAGARSWTGRLASVALILSLAAPGCRPAARAGKATATPTRPIAEVLAAHTPTLMTIPGVVGTYEGERGGRPAIVVMVERRTPEVERLVPSTLEGWPVAIEVTGRFRAMPDSTR